MLEVPTQVPTYWNMLEVYRLFGGGGGGGSVNAKFLSFVKFGNGTGNVFLSFVTFASKLMSNSV